MSWFMKPYALLLNNFSMVLTLGRGGYGISEVALPL